jgi:hypothetical protein
MKYFPERKKDLIRTKDRGILAYVLDSYTNNEKIYYLLQNIKTGEITTLLSDFCERPCHNLWENTQVKIKEYINGQEITHHCVVKGVKDDEYILRKYYISIKNDDGLEIKDSYIKSTNMDGMIYAKEEDIEIDEDINTNDLLLAQEKILRHYVTEEEQELLL